MSKYLVHSGLEDIMKQIQFQEKTYKGTPCWYYVGKRSKKPMMRPNTVLVRDPAVKEHSCNRVLWHYLRPEEPLEGEAIVRQCDDVACVNPFHYFKGGHHVVTWWRKYLAQVSEATQVKLNSVP